VIGVGLSGVLLGTHPTDPTSRHFPTSGQNKKSQAALAPPHPLGTEVENEVSAEPDASFFYFGSHPRAQVYVEDRFYHYDP
jgi:hypothetical protein